MENIIYVELILKYILGNNLKSYFFSTHLQVNDNGILTFGIEFPSFVNRPFPLEYPSIAPFYANVDTTDADPDTTSISYFESSDAQLLATGTHVVQSEFYDEYEFNAESVFVATWENVGYFDRKSDSLNTFQVAIICGRNKTFVQFLYPESGLNWVQAEIGESGLPDVRAQAGFVSEDGRHLSLKGSKTDNVRYLTELSNTAVPGSWIFGVSTPNVDGNVKQPDHMRSEEALEYRQATCQSEGRHKCHAAARCTDKPTGFCCTCNDGYYGNGFNCLKVDAPIRVAGKVSGSLSGSDGHIDSQLQAYVVPTDGRTYAAISPLADNIGFKLQLLPFLAGPIGWLFAKPTENAPNGYQVLLKFFKNKISM